MQEVDFILRKSEIHFATVTAYGSVLIAQNQLKSISYLLFVVCINENWASLNAPCTTAYAKL